MGQRHTRELRLAGATGFHEEEHHGGLALLLAQRKSGYQLFLFSFPFSVWGHGVLREGLN
jgi:hypothetical protein